MGLLDTASRSTDSQIGLKIFVSHIEDWEAAGGVRQKAISRFYLVDEEGHRTLAVSGEELADGHYTYKNAPALEKFGALESRARKDVFTWLERIMKTTQDIGGVDDAKQKDVPASRGGDTAAGLDEHLVFVRYERDMETFADGRKWQKFYLIDGNKKRHLAVQAFEVTDGRYKYTASEPFVSAVPLREGCTSKRTALAWMENFLAPGYPSIPTKAETNSKKHSSVVSNHAQKRKQERLKVSQATKQERAKNSASASKTHQDANRPRAGIKADAADHDDGDEPASEESDDDPVGRGPARAAMRWLASSERQQPVKDSNAVEDDHDHDESGDAFELAGSGARTLPRKVKGARADELHEYDGVPMLELEWVRFRAGTAHRMACALDHLRVEMKAMFESATTHQMIMASSAEEIVNLLNPSQQRLPEPPAVPKVGYSGAGYSRCALMKEAIKPQNKPAEPETAPSGIANTKPHARAPIVPVFDSPAAAEPAQKRARATLEHRSSAPSAVTSVALQNIPDPGTLKQPLPMGSGPAVITAACPEGNACIPLISVHDNHDNNGGPPRLESLKVPDEGAKNGAEDCQYRGPNGAATEHRCPHEPSSDTPAPSKVPALASNSGSDAAPASASPHTAGVTSVTLDRMRGSGGASWHSDAGSESGVEDDAACVGAADRGPNVCMRCLQQHTSSEACRCAGVSQPLCVGDPHMREAAGDVAPVVRLRGSGDETVEAPAGDASGAEIHGLTDRSNADIENQPAEGQHDAAGAMSDAANVDLVESALGALGAIGWGSAGLHRPLRVTNARLQSAVGACVQATGKKPVKKPKGHVALGKTPRPGIPAPLAQVGDLEEQGTQFALNFMTSVERGHKVRGVHAPAVLRPHSEVFPGTSKQPVNQKVDAECIGGGAEQQLDSGRNVGTRSTSHARDDSLTGAQLGKRRCYKTVEEVRDILTNLGEPPTVVPLQIRNFEECQEKNNKKGQRINTLQAWAPTMTARSNIEVALHWRLLTCPLPPPDSIVAAAESILRQRLDLAPPWWVCMPELLPDHINIDHQEATLLFSHSPNVAAFSDAHADETTASQASRADRAVLKRKHMLERPRVNSELLSHPKLQQRAIARLCARHEESTAKSQADLGADNNPPEPLQGLNAALYVPCTASGTGCGASAGSGQQARVNKADVRDPGAWRPLDLHLRGCTDWREVTGLENVDNIQPESLQWSYWDDLVRAQQHIESINDTKADAGFKHTVLQRLLHDPGSTGVEQQQAPGLHAGHRGLPQSFTALPKVMPVSKGICKSAFQAAMSAVPPAGTVPESCQTWAEMGGAHFHAPFESGTPPYNHELDPVVQEMHAEFQSMRAYMLAAKEQASEWLSKQVEVAATMRTFVHNLEALMAAHGVRLMLNSQRHHSTHVVRETVSKALYDHPKSQIAARDFLDTLKCLRTCSPVSGAPSSVPSAAPAISMQPPREAIA